MKRCCKKKWAFAGLAIFFIAGCSAGTVGGPDLSKLVPVSGIVTLDDKPLADALVTFDPRTAAGFHGAVGRTDQSGKYELETDAGNGKTKKGVIPGSYNVTLSKFTKADGTPMTLDPNLGGPMNQGAIQAIPFKYLGGSEEGFSFTVPEGGGTYDIKMDTAGAGS